MSVSPSAASRTPSQLIDERFTELADWRGTTLTRVRDVVRASDTVVIEEWKWRAFQCGSARA